MKDNNKSFKLYHIFIIVMFFLPLLLVIGIAFRGQRNISIIENRPLVTIPKFSFKSFLSGQYQDDLENSLADQLMASQVIKKYKKKISNQVTSNVSDVIKPNTCDYYIEITDNYYNYNCSNYLITKPKSFNFDYSEFKKLYNSINFDEKYIYFIEKDRSIDFENISKKEMVYDYIIKNFDAKDYSRLTLNSYDDLEKYFYQTDHHWNYEGQLKGYQDIIHLLLGNDEVTLNPTSKVTYDVIFNGSASRITVTETSTEKFTVYKYDLPYYRSYINDQEKEYGNPKSYDEKKYSTEIYANHYADYYGTDYAKVVYDFNNPLKENLLVLATSYSNSINNLIASHFNKTYVIDLRLYKDVYQEELDINKFIKDNNIDKVLIMGDIYSFAKGDNNGI